MNICHVYFNNRKFHCRNCISDCNTRMRVRCRIQNNSVINASGLLDFFYNFALNIAGLSNALAMTGNKLVGWIYSHNYDPDLAATIYDGVELHEIDGWDDAKRESGNPILVIHTLAKR